MRIFTKQETRSNDTITFDMLTNIFTGKSYTSAKAIENSDIWSAINIIASDMASLDLEYYLNNAKQESNEFSYLLNVKPNQYYNGYTLKFVIIANILLNGESFVEVVRDDEGNPINLFHVKNSHICYKQDESTKFRLMYDIQSGNETRRVQADDILHFKFFSTDGIKGISPLISLRDDLDTQRNSKRFLSNFFKQGFSGSGILTYKGGKLSKEARDKLKEEWQKANSGSDEAHKVVVLDETMEYEKLEVSTEVLKLINTSQFSSEQIIKVFKIPRHKLGLEVSNLKLEEMNQSYIVNTLNPYLQSLTSEINFKMCCHETRVANYKFNVDAFKFVDIETKTKAVTDQLQSGIIDLNEARKQFGLEAKSDDMFSEHFISLNYSTLSNLSEYQMAKATNLPIKKLDDLKGGDIDE